jgi:hypothetical protein
MHDWPNQGTLRPPGTEAELTRPPRAKRGWPVSLAACMPRRQPWRSNARRCSGEPAAVVSTRLWYELLGHKVKLKHRRGRLEGFRRRLATSSPSSAVLGRAKHGGDAHFHTLPWHEWWRGWMELVERCAVELLAWWIEKQCGGGDAFRGGDGTTMMADAAVKSREGERRGRVNGWSGKLLRPRAREESHLAHVWGDGEAWRTRGARHLSTVSHDRFENGGAFRAR